MIGGAGAGAAGAVEFGRGHTMRAIAVPIVIVVIALCPGPAAFAQGRPAAPGLETLPLSSPAYAGMDALYLASGAGTASNARPWSRSEALLILGRVDRSALGDPLARLYDAVEEAIGSGRRFGEPDGFSLGLGLDLAAEAYYHANPDGFYLESDWAHGFESRDPLARLRLDFALDELMYVYCDLQYGRNLVSYLDEVSNMPDSGVGAVVDERTASDESSDRAERGVYVERSHIFGSGLVSNVVLHSYDFDFEWPKRAVATIGGDRWTASLARDSISWGNGRSGNFVLDGHADFNDYARATAWSDRFKYDWVNVFLPTRTGTSEAPDDEFRVFMAHRLEFRARGSLTLALSEDVMYRNDVFDPRYLNPAFIYHNLNNRSMFNAIAHLELDWAPAPGWKLYAQYALDQGRAPNESAAQANAMAYLGGVERGVAVGPGALTSSIELAWTDPLLYRRDGVDFIVVRRYFCHGDPGGYGYVSGFDYLGYPYGGDVQLARADVEYLAPGVGTFAVYATAMRRGQMSFFTSHNLDGDNDGMADYEGSTPSGDEVDESLVVGLYASVELPKPPVVAEAGAWLRVDWIGRRARAKADGTYSDAEADLQVSAGLSASL